MAYTIAVAGKGGVGKTTVCGMMIDALIKGGKADEQENAKKFIDWMTSEAGQGCYAENDSFRVPTNTDAPVADGLVTLDQVPVIDYDAVWAASVKSEYCEQFENKIATKPEG